MLPCTAIFDIGKTNKKLVLFNTDLQIVHEIQTNFEEVKDEDGDNCEDLRALTNWMLETWELLEKDFRFDIKALNFTTYGASFVHLDISLRPVTPLYNYLKKFPQDIENSFFDKYGDKLDFSTQTASPFLGMLNSGLQIYWLKYCHPAIYSKIKYSLHFPQFCSFLFTKNLATEFTSIGCHTGLWDMKKSDYHNFIYQENIFDKLPGIQTQHLNGTTNFRNKPIPVGVGLHDSSAALIPYFKYVAGNFLLLSTGTWCITLNPYAKLNLTKKELQNDCLNFLTFEGKQVKASRVFSGSFHENYTKRFSGHFFKDRDYYKNIVFNLDTFNKISQNPALIKDKFHPDKYYHANDLDIYQTYEEAYHKLMLDIVNLQVDAIILAGEGLNDIDQLFVDGGFSKNEIFMYLLKQKMPNLTIRNIDISQGTSLGGAMVMSEYVGL